MAKDFDYLRAQTRTYLDEATQADWKNDEVDREINNGYHELEDLVITKVNGQRVNDLRQMIRIIEEETTKPYVEFETIDRDYVVIDRNLAEENSDIILATYNIPRDRSEDLILELNNLVGNRP